MSTTRRKLWLSRSVVPFMMDFSSDPEKTVLAAFERLRERNRVLPGDPIVVVSDVAAGQETVTALQVRVFLIEETPLARSGTESTCRLREICWF